MTGEANMFFYYERWVELVYFSHSTLTPILVSPALLYYGAIKKSDCEYGTIVMF